jgi:GT2 family glycosyltransferase
VFGALGGFPEIPIMEDVAFARRLRRAGRLTFVHSGLVASGRRWNANGVLRTMLVNWWVTMLFFLHVPPRQLRRIYDSWLVSVEQQRSRDDVIRPGRRSLQKRT